jgi:hypothetical protein
MSWAGASEFEDALNTSCVADELGGMALPDQLVVNAAVVVLQLALFAFPVQVNVAARALGFTPPPTDTHTDMRNVSRGSRARHITHLRPRKR